MTAPNATLMISSHCHHCATTLAALADLVKQGIVGQLTVVNVERHPELAGDRRPILAHEGPFASQPLRAGETHVGGHGHAHHHQHDHGSDHTETTGPGSDPSAAS